MEPGLCVRPTQRFAVIERRPQQSDVPRVPLAEVAAPRTLELLRERGYVVVTDLDDAFLRAIAAQERAFLDFYARDAARKKRSVRECFSAQASAPAAQPWPNRGARAAWVDLVGRLATLADAVLDAAVGVPSRPRDGDDDFSLAYSFLYGVDDGGGNGGDASTLVGEHADVSLVVCEPVSRAPGLEVFDETAAVARRRGARAGGGRRLRGSEHRTGIPACRHRVVKCAPARPRRVLEQKYAAFFQHLRQFDG
ncbi:hypothetical protein JL720_4287 [Aureococcus anophagefferens]|nr:hypothetical protein JL720_4287 [Aureococcus anophagefferens]